MINFLSKNNKILLNVVTFILWLFFINHFYKQSYIITFYFIPIILLYLKELALKFKSKKVSNTIGYLFDFIVILQILLILGIHSIGCFMINFDKSMFPYIYNKPIIISIYPLSLLFFSINQLIFKNKLLMLSVTIFLIMIALTIGLL